MELDSIFDVILRKHQERNRLNGTNGSEILQFDFMAEHYVVSITFLVLILIGICSGIIGNTLIIGGVLSYKRLRTTGNMFIVNLAAADLIVVTIVQPFNVIGILLGPRFFMGKLEGLCHMVATVCVMSCACSMMTLSAISVNRFIFVCKNIAYNSIYSKKKTLIYIMIIWVVVGLVDLPNYLGWGAHTFDYKTMGCVFDRGYLPYTMFLSTLIYWVPLTLVFVCYISIYVYVNRQRKYFRKQMSKHESSNASIIEARREQDIRMIRTFVLVVCVFILCWVPYFILVLFDREEKMSTAIYAISLAIGHTNSSINSILYGATNQKFRRGYKIFLIRFFRCCSNDGKKTTSSNFLSKSSTGNEVEHQNTEKSSLPTATCDVYIVGQETGEVQKAGVENGEIP